MSRCFPFPPPGYRARGDALIESIKLREEMEKAEKEKREKKEKRREKKERKRKKKEKRKEKKERKLKEGTTTTHASNDGEKFKFINEIKETKADGKLQKGQDCENELLERSGITEELDQPVTSPEPCSLSDTQSSKRKRDSLQSTQDHGPAIKIRLPLRKHREPEEPNSKSKFQVGSSSGNVRTIADSFTKTTLANNHQSQCLTSTYPKRIPTNSDSNHCKALQKSGNAGVTKNTLGFDRQSQSLRFTEPKRVPGNSDSRHGNAMQNLVREDAGVTKSTLGIDRQSQCPGKTDPKQVLGTSDSRQGKVIQNSVHGDAMVTQNTLGRDHPSQFLRTAGTTKNNLGRSGRQSQGLRNTEPKRVLENSGSSHCKAMQNSVHGDAVVTRNTFGSDRQSQCVKITESKRVLGNSDSNHCKALQNSVHGDAMVTDNSVDDAMNFVSAVDEGSLKVESLYKSMLQIPPLTYGLDSLDEDWLFSLEPAEAKPVSKKLKSDSDVFQPSSSMWPRAQYLPEVEIYALPYAVPF